jgi:hypothetical protein
VLPIKVLYHLTIEFTVICCIFDDAKKDSN